MTALAPSNASPVASPIADSHLGPSARRDQRCAELVLVRHLPDQLLVLSLTGQVTTISDVYATLNEAFSQRPVRLVLDASEMRSWDRLWLAALLDSSRRAAEEGIRFAIADRSGRLPSTIQQFQGCGRSRRRSIPASRRPSLLCWQLPTGTEIPTDNAAATDGVDHVPSS